MGNDTGIKQESRQRVAVCDTQPVTAEGLRVLLESSPDFEFVEWAESLQAGTALVQAHAVDVLLMDKAFGTHAVLEWLHDVRSSNRAPRVVVWGVSMTEAEALRFLQAGASGIVRKSAGLRILLSCIQSVAGGRTWMEDNVFRDSLHPENYPRSDLTAREHQVLELVEQGFKNKEIANELGIRPGTVKIHLKHIFEKTGVRGRYGLALSGLKDHGLVPLAS